MTLKRSTVRLRPGRLARPDPRRSDRRLVEFRSRVLARDGYACQRCGSKTRVAAHHIVTRARAPGWDGLHKPENGVALCSICHGAVHDHTASDWRKWLKSLPHKSTRSP